MDRVTHKHVESAVADYNKALKLHGWRGDRPPSIGRLQWADIRGDGRSRRNLYVVTTDSSGVDQSDLRRATMRQTIAAIRLAIRFERLKSYQVITRAIHERGEVQRIALRELARRGLWLSDDQKRQAELTSKESVK